MYENNILQTRYLKSKFTYKDEDNEIKTISIDIEPPKLKVLNKVLKLLEKQAQETQDENPNIENAINQYSQTLEILRLALNKNKQNFKFNAELVEDVFSADEMYEFLSAYMKWVNGVKSDPN